MELIVLGAGPAYTDRAGSAAAAHLVRHDDSALLFDLGQGAFPNLARTMPPERLTAIAISHLHPDHFIDLVPLRHYLRYQCRPPGRVLVVGPSALEARLDALHAEQGFAAAALDVDRLDDGPRALGPFVLEARHVTHTNDSFAFRVSLAGRPADPGLVYSGDCGVADDLAPLVRPGDTLLAEVSFGPGPVPPGVPHLDGPAVGALATRTGVGRLLLTHLQMGFDPGGTLDAVRGSFDGAASFVWEGDRLAL